MKASINGISMTYDDYGQGPAVVLIHGYGVGCQMWSPQTKSISAGGFRVIAPNLRGFGESEAPDGHFDISTFADDITQLLNYLGIGRAVVCGMSMGGYVLMDLLERHPQRVAAACFIATRCQSDNAKEKASREKLADMISGRHRQATLESFARLLFARDLAPGRLELTRKVHSWLAAADPQSLAGTLLAMRDRKDYTAQIRNFSRPALVVRGDMDQIIHPKHSKFLTATLPHCTSRVISGAGHMVNIEQPVEFNKCLLDFLGKLRRVRM
jgi:3-oxoadipate enol-lactonase